MRHRVDHDQVKSLATQRLSWAEVGARAGCTPSYARMIAGGKMKLRSEGAVTLSRQEPQTLSGKSASLPAYDHPALMDGKTIYPSTVVNIGEFDVLKSAFNSAKIGKRITKGRWKDFPVFTLTLEERATCPTACKHWRSCFGNHMQFAQRFVAGAALERRLEDEVAARAMQHRGGFAVRLHVLGDFYSVEYVDLWRRLIDKHPELHVFGFSARWDYHHDIIAKSLIDLAGERWDRFAIRFSNAPVDECSTISIEHPYQKPEDAIICPQQLGQTSSCSTCALCWQTKRRIAFLQH